MPFFTNEMLDFFEAENGAFSKVTDREATGDKSVTLERAEKEIIYSIYPQDTISRKGGAINSNEVRKDFIIVKPEGNTIQEKLAITYPKRRGQELRLYFRRGIFEARTNDIWFVFKKAGENIPYIGSMDQNEWEKISQYLSKIESNFEEYITIDDEDEIYQFEIGAAAARAPKLSSSLRYPRNPSVALRALKAANHLCEGDPEHETFLSISGNPYMEAHHLIPISLQDRFDVSLDVPENITSLCPTDHRKIHYGVPEEKIALIERLWNLKKEGINRREINITYEELLFIYNIK